MKLTITLTAAETVESIMAFGIEPLLSNQLAKQVGDIVFINFDENVEKFKVAVNNHDFSMSDATSEVINSLFGFDDGRIERLSSPEKVVMKNGEIITDFQIIEKLIDKANIVDEIAYSVDEIAYSEVTIDLGQSC